MFFHKAHGMMITKRKVGLRTKFNLLSLSLILATALGLGVLVVQHEQSSSYDGLILRGKITAAMLAKNAEYSLYTENQEALNQIVDSVKLDPDKVDSFGIPQRSSISAIDDDMSFRMANSFGPHEQLMRSCGMPKESTLSGSSLTLFS